MFIAVFQKYFSFIASASAPIHVFPDFFSPTYLKFEHMYYGWAKCNCSVIVGRYVEKSNVVFSTVLGEKKISEIWLKDMLVVHSEVEA